MKKMFLSKLVLLLSILSFFICGTKVLAECTFDPPAFYVSESRLDVPCLSYNGICYHLTIGLDRDHGLYLKDVKASIPASDWVEGGATSYVATIDMASTLLHIPQVRIRENDGLVLSIAYDIDLTYFVQDGWILFDIKSLSPVLIIDDCIASTGSDQSSDVNNDSSNSTEQMPNEGGDEVQTSQSSNSEYIVIAYNDLGMHCMNQDHSVLSILPPYNNIMAQVIKRGEEPKIITSGVRVEYRLLENTTCEGTNFWDYAEDLFGEKIEFCTGLTGNGLSGEMTLKGDRFVAEGVPVTPFNNNGEFNPYPLAEVVVKAADSGEVLATTQTVVPISYEMNCNKCHGGDGGRETMLNIVKLHDLEEGTSLQDSTPVLCQSCHADPALGTSGISGVPNFSLAIHGKHASVDDKPGCYDCHPGPETQCQRTAIEGMQSCEGCHGDLSEMARKLENGRTPWMEEPKCADCHSGKEIDTGTTLYREAQGHHGVYCETCHYEPHAWWPSKLDKDNGQPKNLQGGTGPLGSKSCLVCHTSIPDEDEGPHGISASGHDGVGYEDGDDDD